MCLRFYREVLNWNNEIKASGNAIYKYMHLLKVIIILNVKDVNLEKTKTGKMFEIFMELN